MRRSVRLVRTLIYYDGPQVIVASDEVGQLYLGLLVQAPDGGDAYLLTPVSADRLYQLETGVLDIRGALTIPEVKEYYTAALTGDTEVKDRLPLTPVDHPPEKWLPEPGLRVSDFVEPNAVTQEVTARGKAVLHLRISPPESHIAAQIGVTNLATCLSLFQNLVGQAYRKVLRDVGSDTRELISDESNWMMDVSGFSHGSFTIHLQSRAEPDLLGYVGLSRALDRVDALTEGIDAPEAGLSTMRQNRGHLVAAYRRLLKFLVDSESALGYQWSAPDRTFSSTRAISRDSAERLYSLIVAQKDLTVEEVTLRGVFIHVNVESGLWTLRDDEGISHHGRSASDLQGALSGLIVDTQRYEVDCIERVEETGVGEIRTSLELKGIEPLEGITTT